MNLVERIKKAIKEERWTVNRLAKEANVPHTTLFRYLRGETDLNFDYALAIAKVLNLKVTITPEGIQVEDFVFARDDKLRKEEIRKELLAILRELGEIGDEKTD